MEQQAFDFVNALGALAVRYALDLVAALAIVVIGWMVAARAQRTVARWLERTDRVDQTLRPFLAKTVRYAILAFVIIALLAQFGVQTTSIIAVLGAAGLAIGLALQGTLSNIAAGMMLLLLRPCGVSDYIDAEGISGTVMEIGPFMTQLRTYDGVYVSVPNSRLWNRQIKNFSRLPTRRLDLPIGIGYDDDVDKAMTVLKELLDNDPRVLADPAAQVMIDNLGDSAVIINMRCWANAGDYWDLLFDLTKRTKLRLDAESISIPYPQQDVHFKAQQGLPATPAAA